MKRFHHLAQTAGIEREHSAGRTRLGLKVSEWNQPRLPPLAEWYIIAASVSGWSAV